MKVVVDEAGFAELKERIRRYIGFNCNLYKPKCLKRRIATRLRARGVRSYREYAALLAKEPAELPLLEEALTINVSKFFRNYELFSLLEREVFPRLGALAEERKLSRLFFWSAGSATGEEPYTLAIMAKELLPKKIDVRILGTDISKKSLEAARRGIYPPASLDETPERIKEKYFVFEEGHYHLAPEIKEMVTFRKLDLLADPYPQRVDLILCRNVLIYLTKEAQDIILSGFFGSLVPRGVLVLGKVEALSGEARKLFSPIDVRERVYSRPFR